MSQTSVQEITNQFGRYSRFFGGSIRLVAYLVLLLTIAWAAAAIALVAPFRDGQVKGIYWSLILYEEISTRYVLPISAAAIVLLLAWPFIARVRNPQYRGMPGIFKLITALLMIATIAAWTVIGLNLFKSNHYTHVQSLLANDHLYHMASKLENSKRDMRYIVYSCDKTELNCSLVYNQVFPEGNPPTYTNDYKKVVTLRFDDASHQLMLVWPKFKERPDTNISLPSGA
jgi:hypothetical protein